MRYPPTWRHFWPQLYTFDSVSNRIPSLLVFFYFYFSFRKNNNEKMLSRGFFSAFLWFRFRFVFGEFPFSSSSSSIIFQWTLSLLLSAIAWILAKFYWKMLGPLLRQQRKIDTELYLCVTERVYMRENVNTNIKKRRPKESEAKAKNECSQEIIKIPFEHQTQLWICGSNSLYFRFNDQSELTSKYLQPCKSTAKNTHTQSKTFSRNSFQWQFAKTTSESALFSCRRCHWQQTIQSNVFSLLYKTKKRRFLFLDQIK